MPPPMASDPSASVAMTMSLRASLGSDLGSEMRQRNKYVKHWFHLN